MPATGNRASRKRTPAPVRAPADAQPPERTELYRTLFDFSPAGILLQDEHGKIIDANEALCVTSGYSRAELIGQHVRIFAPKESHQLLQGHLHSIVGGQQLHHEVINVHKDGTRRAIRLHETVVPLPNGRPGVLSITEDITARKEAEQALRDAHAQLEIRVRERTEALQTSEARFRALFESAPIGIAQGDVTDAHYISANRRYCEIVGYTRDELANLNFKDITHPEDLQADLANLNRLIAGEIRSYRMEKRFIRKGGTVVWCWLTVAALWPEGEKPRHFMAVLEDITARKKTESALRFTTERLRAGVKVAGLGYFDHDHAADKIYYSSIMREIHGFKPSDEITLPAISQRVFPDDLAEFMAAVKRAHDPAGDGKFNSEHRLVMPDGRIRWVFTRSQTTFVGDGAQRRPSRTIGALVDITEHKLAEENLRRAHDELERRVAERTAELARMNLKLTGEIAERQALQEEILNAGERERQRLGQNLHDGLCQILAAARLKADSLVSALSNAKPATRRNLQSVAHLVAQAMEDAHGLARGLEPVEPVPEGLMAALQQLAAAMEKLFHVGCACDFAQPVMVADHKAATELFRIAQEAINNAIKHGHAKNIVIELTQKSGKTRLSVASDGRPFPRGRVTLGMGLRTMRFRADRIGARLEIRRGQRSGTIVLCSLPDAAARAPKRAAFRRKSIRNFSKAPR